MKKRQMRPKLGRYLPQLLLIFLFLLLILIVLNISQLRVTTSRAFFRPLRLTVSDFFSQYLKPAASTSAWLDNDRQLIRDSSWFRDHVYVDCPTDALAFWPQSVLDCLIPDELGGPSKKDQATVADPLGLYYKHVSPTDALKLVEDLLKDLARQPTGWPRRRTPGRNGSLSYNDFTTRLKEAARTNPQAFITISLDSLIIGLEGGKDGKVVRSLSLMVHPELERIITDQVGTLPRAKILYQPFIEGAVGQAVSEEDVHQLYLAALNRCGRAALGGDQSGLGVKRSFGQYVAVVQSWQPGGVDFIQDCNIHLVKRSN